MEKAVVVVEWDEKEDNNKSKRNARRLVFGIGYFGGAFLCDAWRRGSGNDGVKKKRGFSRWWERSTNVSATYNDGRRSGEILHAR